MKKDYSSEYDKNYLSFEKISCKKIKDIIGYTCEGFDGDHCFKIHAIIFEDKTKFFVEGEHDLPYITVDEKTDATIKSVS